MQLIMAFRCGQKYDNQIKIVQNHFPVRNYKLHTEFWKIAIEFSEFGVELKKDETKLASKTEVQKHKLKVEFSFF